MTLLRGLDDQLHQPGLFDDPPGAVAMKEHLAPMAHATDDGDDVEVVEVRTPLAVITWSAAAMAAGLVVMAVVLLLGPLVGPAALVAAIVVILSRYQHSGGDVDEP